MIRFRRLRAAAALLLCTSLVSSAFAQQAPPLQDSPYRPSAATDEGGLWMLSDKAEREVQRSSLLVRDEALNAYMRDLVCDLAGPHCGSIRVYILDIPYFNANMAPNGAMQVWTGMLLRSKNEAQLAFVLSHEVAHYVEKHTLDRYQSTRDTANALTFLSLATGGIVGGVAMLIAAGSLSAYSRDQEREADSYGFDAIVAKGYDPKEGAAIWEQLEAERKANPNREEQGYFFASHPATEERMEMLRTRAAAIESTRSDWKTGRDTFLDVIRPFRAQWLEAELNRGQYVETAILIERLLSGEPESGVLRYYRGELYRRQNENANAMTAYRDAIAAQGVPAEAWRGLGLVALKTKDNVAARQAFTEYLALAPQADDRAMIEFYLSGLQGE